MDTEQRIKRIKFYITQTEREVAQLRQARTIYHNNREMKHVNEATRQIEFRKKTLAEAEVKLERLTKNKPEIVVFT